MARATNGEVRRYFRDMFQAGTVAGLGDGELLERLGGECGPFAELAFSTLVERHGPMVLRVCRRVLTDPHDAEDAFQAVFLVLAHRVGSIRSRESLASWLHGVALRVASASRAARERRRVHERAAGERVAIPIPDPSADDELGRALHEEIARLPQRLRATVVLCCFEGHTYEEAARQLSCPVGTVKSRLATAREKLRLRLTRRGLAPSTRMFTALFGTRTATAQVPRALALPAVRSASWMATGRLAPAGVVPAAVAALMEGALKTMILTKVRMTATVLLVAGIGVGTVGMGVLARQSPGQTDQAGIEIEAKRSALTPAKVGEGGGKGQKRRRSFARELISRKLDEPISLELRGQALQDALESLHTSTGLHFMFDRRAMNAEKITPRTQVTLTVSRIRLRTALRLLLEPLGLTYTIEDDFVRITTRTGLPSATTARTYYVGDLVLPSGREDGDRAEESRSSVDISPLIELITSTVPPGTWKGFYESGEPRPAGRDGDDRMVGSITPFYLSISLIIRHTDEVHDQIWERLRQLRRLRRLTTPPSAAEDVERQQLAALPPMAPGSGTGIESRLAEVERKLDRILKVQNRSPRDDARDP
jgi:RNA polymerase sigma factor (sigma-70 family)